MLRLFLQAAKANRFEIAIDAPVQRARRHRFLVDDFLKHFDHAIALERRHTGQHLEEHHAQAVNIRCRGQFGRLAGGLLGGHVARAAHDALGPRQRLPAFRQLGETEIGDERLAAGVQKDVCRLDVAVQHAVLVRVVHGPRDFGQQFGGLARGQRLAAKAPGEVRPIHEPHREVVLPLVLSHVEHRDDVRMIQPCDCLRLAIEALDKIARREGPGQKHLEGDYALEADLTRLVDHAHPASGDFLQQLVVAEQPGVRCAGDRRGLLRRGRLVIGQRHVKQAGRAQ